MTCQLHRGAPRKPKRSLMKRNSTNGRAGGWSATPVPTSDGVTRWRCPFCAGLLRSRQVPKTMRASRNSPLVRLGEGSTNCCSGILSVAAVELPLAQRIPYGTTAWRISMGRRQVVESVNAALKGSFVDLSRGFFRVFGRVKTSVLLGFTLAAFNLDRIRSFRAKHGLEEGESVQDVASNPSPRKKRRRGTWAQIIEERPQAPCRPTWISPSFCLGDEPPAVAPERIDRDSPTRNRRPWGRRFRRPWGGGRALNSSPPPTRHFHEHSACSFMNMPSSRGGGGNRTRVLRSRSRPSPSAAGIRLSGAALLPAAVPPRNQRVCPRRSVGVSGRVSPTE